MTRQEILEAITRNRANPVHSGAIPSEVERKFSEIEWALQALAEDLCAEQIAADTKAEAVAAAHKEEPLAKGKKKHG